MAGSFCLSHSTLRKGKHKLHVWPDVEADGSVDTTTPSKVKSDDDMDKLEKVISIQKPDAVAT